MLGNEKDPTMGYWMDGVRGRSKDIEMGKRLALMWVCKMGKHLGCVLG